jgi:hypothetical protein
MPCGFCWNGQKIDIEKELSSDRKKGGANLKEIPRCMTD